MSSMNVALTGMQAADKAMAAVSQNISNMSTPDYKRLEALFTAMDFSGPNNVPFNPGGVKADIRTSGDIFLDNRLTSALGDAAKAAAFADGLKMIGDNVSTKPVEEAFNAFMSSTQDLNINPNDPVRQEAWSQAGQAFSTALKGLGDSFTTATRQITMARDMRQIQLENLQAEMSQLTAGPITDDAKAQLETLQKQVLMLTNSIQGYNQVLSGVVPPLQSMYVTARNTVVDGTNLSYGQNILDTNGGFSFTPAPMGDVVELTQWNTHQGTTEFSNQMGVLNVNLGSKVNAADNANAILQAMLDNVKKDVQDQTGVDLVDQSVKMLQYQHMYEACAKVIQIQDEMMGTLLNIRA